MLIDGQMGQKSFDLGFRGKQILPAMHAVETDELDCPINVRALRVDGIVVNPEDPAKLIQNFGLLTFGRDRHKILLKKWHIVYCFRVIIAKRQKCPKTMLLSTYQGKFA